ncbi:MAG TPA: porin [Burkholderiaceae bacterium]|nr:porin [Burkholderiaceae bacterium]
MKKSLLALAVLGTFAGVASAQSSVTLFGIVDVGLRNVKNGSNPDLWTQSTDGLNSSRLGFRGVEDLGGGLSAGFWLEAGLAADTGNMGGGIGIAAPTNGSANIFNRRATVSLMGNWGEVRLGRDYTPGFWNTTIFDPFGTNGVGSFLNMTTAAGGPLGVPVAGANTSYVRANNTFGYFLPSNLGGLYGQLQSSLQEGGTPNGNKQNSFRIGYAAGPFNAAFSYQKTEIGSATDWEHMNLGGSWNFGFMTLMGFWDKAEFASAEQENFLIGAVVPFGQGEFKIAYTDSDLKGSVAGVSINAAEANQLAIGYVYNVSKRTALYGHYAVIDNDGGANFTISGGSGAATNGKSKGFELGVRHSF